MWDRLFGRNKEEGREPACAACGRTLLPGEWAQSVVTDEGFERVLCSLCAQSNLIADNAPPYTETEDVPGPISVSGRPQPIRPRTQRESHEDSDAFWRALKDKDAQIARLESELLQAEAQRQELLAQISLLQRQLRGEAVTDWQAAAFEPHATPAASWAPADTPPLAPASSVIPGDAALVSDDEPRQPAPAETTPAALGAAEATVAEASALPPQPDSMTDVEEDEHTASIARPQPGPATEQDADAGPAWLFDTPPHQTFGGDTVATLGAGALASSAEGHTEAESDEDAAAGDTGAPHGTPLEQVPSTMPVEQDAQLERASFEAALASSQVEEAAPAASTEELEAEERALPLLQRGADLLNVSGAPRKVAETSESLGIPFARLSSDGETVTAVFLWSMAWYEFAVDLASGDVSLKERGYEDRADLIPNAKVRADGTVQVTPLPTRRSTARPAQQPSSSAVAAREVESPPASPGKGEIISKSLMGQRTDDEQNTWDEMSARDFDWGR
jgi:hypothetical protein